MPSTAAIAAPSTVVSNVGTMNAGQLWSGRPRGRRGARPAGAGSVAPRGHAPAPRPGTACRRRDGGTPPRAPCAPPARGRSRRRTPRGARKSAAAASRELLLHLGLGQQRAQLEDRDHGEEADEEEEERREEPDRPG